MAARMAASTDSLNKFWAAADASGRFIHLVNNDFHSDVTFLVGSDKRKVSGHSFILIYCSWDFYNIFELLKLDSYVFTIEDVKYDSFLAFLEYCYTLKVDLSKDEILEKALEIMKLAQRFHLPALVDICEKDISSKCKILTNTMTIYKHRAMFTKDSSVLKDLMYNIKYYFSSIIQQPRNVEIFVDLPLEAVRDIAKLSPIQCDEMELFDVLMKWAKRNCKKNEIIPSSRNLRMILKDVFYQIRFPIMKSAWFVHVIANYLDMFSAQEIRFISNRIDGKRMNCPRFQCEPRAKIDHIYKIFPFGVNVIFFSGVPDMDNGLTKKMIANFCAKKTKKLIGFAFVVKKNEEVKVTSCKLKLPSDDWKNIETEPGVRSKFNWDYDLIAKQFEENQEIVATSNTNNYNYQLVCEFDKLVPNIYGKALAKNMNHCGICKQDNEPNTIPYLIVMLE